MKLCGNPLKSEQMARKPRRYAKVLTVPIYKGRMYDDLMKAFKEKYPDGRECGDLQEWLINVAIQAMWEDFKVNPMNYI